MKTFNIKLLITLFTSCFAFQNTSAQFGKANNVQLPATYEFDYIYKLKMTHKKGDVTFDYYLKRDAEYFGFDSEEMSKANPDSKMFMVMDSKLQVMAMFMEMMGKKVVQKTKMKASDFRDDTDNSGYTFNKTGSKTIMGYECEGFVAEDDKAHITFYITDDVPVSFNKVFGADIKNLPKGFNPDWMKKYKDKGLMMEMIFKDKKKSKNNMTMQCIGLDKTDFSIDTSKYGSMMSAFGG